MDEKIDEGGKIVVSKFLKNQIKIFLFFSILMVGVSAYADNSHGEVSMHYSQGIEHGIKGDFTLAQEEFKMAADLLRKKEILNNQNLTEALLFSDAQRPKTETFKFDYKIVIEHANKIAEDAASGKLEKKKAIADFRQIFASEFPTTPINAIGWELPEVYRISDKCQYEPNMNNLNLLLAMQPSDAIAFRERGLQLIACYRSFDKAVDDFISAINLNPKDSMNYKYCGVANLVNGKFDKAAEYLNKAVFLNSNDSDAYYLRGLTLLKKGDFEQAISDFTNSISLNPSAYYAYIKRGEAYFYDEKDKQAENDWEKVVTDYREGGPITAIFAEDNLKMVKELQKLLEAP